MAQIIIYTTRMCPYCVAAKRLLIEKGAAFEEIDVTFDTEARRDMAERAGGVRTVPQIFIGDRHVGGCDDLYDLNAGGGLDPLLEA